MRPVQNRRLDRWPNAVRSAVLAAAVAFGTIPLSVSAQETPVSAEDDRRAVNRLAVEARQLYNDALRSSQAARIEKLKSVIELLNTIISDYPGSDHAVTLIGGGEVAGISIPAIEGLIAVETGDAPGPDEDGAEEQASSSVLVPELTGAAAVMACDERAGSPNDTTLEGTGIWQTLIDVDTATEACTAALKAEPDNPRLRFQLGRAIFRSGDHAGSLPHFEAASEAGHMLSRAQLGLMYILGQGYEKDEPKGIVLLKETADAGDPFAIAMLGELRTKGLALARDVEDGFALYKLAAERGSPVGMHRMGEAYATGNGVERNDALALEWLRKAIDAGAPGAHFAIGVFHRDGRVVEKDAEKAFFHFSETAKLGVGSAMYELGVAYVQGRGVEENAAEAVTWLLKAVEAGDRQGYYTLSYAYAFGEGVERNPDEAARFMFLALKTGAETAIEQMKANADQWPPDMRRALQQRMKDAGFYNSTIDGSFGPATKRAIDKLTEG